MQNQLEHSTPLDIENPARARRERDGDDVVPPLLQAIESWVWPLSLREFRQQHWLRRLFVQHRGAAAVGAYHEVMPRHAVEEGWLSSMGGAAKVPIHVDGCTVDVAGMHHGEALKFYRAGHPIYVTYPECLAPSALSLAHAFDLPPTRVGCLLQLSKRGARTPPHFDGGETFAIQLRGTKVWRHTTSHGVQLPLENWGFGKPVPPSIRDYAPDEWRREEVLADAREIVATPGTVLYMPRGQWHTTETREDSISVNVHYKTVSWADLALVAIRKELYRLPEWREAAFGLGSDDEERRRATVELAPLLAKLATNLAGIDASDLIGPANSATPAHAGDTAKYRRVALASVGIDATAENGAKVMRFTLSAPLHDMVSEFEVPESFVPVCLWIASRPLEERFGIDDISRFGVSRVEARQMLPALVAAGLIECVAE